ncbi:MAG: PEP-CTERM sorting domain-containing protein [Gammaproteobacteria bacterium]|nr:PEP-CTERM sorting domain-containing protein [Gammaproteobacteria bacterium]
MKTLRQLLLTASIFAISSVASAIVMPTTPIVGGIAFSSETNAYWTSVDSLWNSTTLAASTGISFTAGDNGFDQNVVEGTGSFAGTENTGVDFFDFQFSPLASGTPLWSFNYSGLTYSFTMNSVTTLVKGTSTILLEGNGFMSIDGYADTYGNWDFSGNRFSFSSSAVPEPGLALLLGVGLIGFGVSRKLRKTA